MATVGLLPAAAFVLERRTRRAQVARIPPGTAASPGGEAVGFNVSGPEDATPPAIVLLPGAGDSAASWALVEGRLKGSHRVLTYERSPHGAGAAREAHLAGLVKQLDDMLDGSDPVLLVGHSFGGLLARAYAATHPDRVAGLVLVDATPPAIANDPGVAVGFAISAGLARALRALSPFGVVRAMVALNAMPLYPEQRRFRRATTADAYRRWATAVSAGFAGGAAEELAAVLPDVRAFVASAPGPLQRPVGLVYSRAYGPKWEQMQRDVATELAAVSVAATRERHHNIQMSRPDLVEHSIVDVLKRLSPPAPEHFTRGDGESD